MRLLPASTTPVAGGGGKEDRRLEQRVHTQTGDSAGRKAQLKVCDNEKNVGPYHWRAVVRCDVGARMDSGQAPQGAAKDGRRCWMLQG